MQFRHLDYEPDHPTLAISYNNMAHVEWELGNRTEARRLMRQAHAIFLARQGEEHPKTQSSRRWLEAHDPEFGERNPKL